MPTYAEIQAKPEVYGQHGWTWDLVYPEGGKRHLQGDYQETFCGKNYYGWRVEYSYYYPAIQRMTQKGKEQICKKCSSSWRNI
jgi:hypothetical protein